MSRRISIKIKAYLKKSIFAAKKKKIQLLIQKMSDAEDTTFKPVPEDSGKMYSYTSGILKKKPIVRENRRRDCQLMGNLGTVKARSK